MELKMWQLMDAKNRFSELVEKALHAGPQHVSRRGVDAVVVVSAVDYGKLTSKAPSFKDFLMSGESFEGLEFERDQSGMREVEL